MPDIPIFEVLDLIPVKYLKPFLLVLILILSMPLIGQKDKDKGFIFLPVMFSSPETSVGFGGAAMYYFRMDSLQEKPSNFRGVFIYTLQDQIISQFPFTLYFKNDDIWLFGETSYFIYPFQYYGQGSQIDLDRFDSYTAKYFRFFMDAMQKVDKDFYIGARFRYENYFSLTADSERGILTENVTGFQKGIVAGAGLGLILDRRNNVFCASKGHYLEASWVHYGGYLTGDYNFTDYQVDLRKFYSPTTKTELAFQLYHQSTAGRVPFYNLARLGGHRYLRGYFQGAYRDKHFSVLQGEFRAYVHRRFLLAAFAGAGSVTSELLDYQRILPSAGAGLRFELNKKEKIRIRIDYAIGRNSQGFYLNINEAF
ncbi:MAG: BamA/TamA family outer membrane protein [Cyclobacteriaceae bacterium]|nr:BamA/TamA family outer membrane protein [Cyclobacteriaceae bacterium HetDA_MAG_MS6]